MRSWLAFGLAWLILLGIVVFLAAHRVQPARIAINAQSRPAEHPAMLFAPCPITRRNLPLSNERKA